MAKRGRPREWEDEAARNRAKTNAYRDRKANFGNKNESYGREPLAWDYLGDGEQALFELKRSLRSSFVRKKNPGAYKREYDREYHAIRQANEPKVLSWDRLEGWYPHSYDERDAAVDSTATTDDENVQPTWRHVRRDYQNPNDAADADELGDSERVGRDSELTDHIEETGTEAGEQERGAEAPEVDDGIVYLEDGEEVSYRSIGFRGGRSTGFPAWVANRVSNIKQLSRLRGLGWLRTEPELIQGLAVKIHTLGRDETDQAFSAEELARITNLVRCGKVGSQTMIDAPPQRKYSSWLKRWITVPTRRYYLKRKVSNRKERIDRHVGIPVS